MSYVILERDEQAGTLYGECPSLAVAAQLAYAESKRELCSGACYAVVHDGAVYPLGLYISGQPATEAWWLDEALAKYTAKLS